MAEKNSHCRITQTSDYIAAWKGGSNSQYAKKIAKHLMALQKKNINITSISNEMAQGSYLFHNITNKELRAKRRAIIFLRCVLHGISVSGANATVSKISDHMLDYTINYEIGLAKHNIEKMLKLKWDDLCKNTANFLQNHTIHMVATKPSGVTTYQFLHDEDRDRYDLKPQSASPEFIDIQVTVNHIPVIPYPNVQNSLTQLDGVDLDTQYLAVTTQLTGCSYVYQINNNQAQATHISPASLNNGAALTSTLRNGSADFANSNGGTTYVFGAGTSNTTTEYDPAKSSWTYVIAVYNNAWQLHAQQVPFNATTPRTYTRIV